MSDSVRCKFRCDSVTRKVGSAQHPFLYDYTFSVVYNGSPENVAFWAYTPSGTLTISAVKLDQFEPGREYYLDLTPAC